ncbi:MAG TPA: hypothetical protein DCQ83_02810 [Fibrobacteres bacterium]|jgi:hypothetical protein|nr:hypothetical protein [Fibrobacterota bacterium]
MKTIATLLLLVVIHVRAQETMVRLVSASQCAEIGNSDVRTQCIETLKTQTSFEYPKRMQLYVSPGSQTLTSAPVVVEAAPKPVDNRTQTEKDIHVIAIATSVTAVVSVISLVCSFILLGSI